MDNNSESDRPRMRIRPSCVPCQRLKKRCDRQKPHCSLCVRRNQPCFYSASPDSTGSAPSHAVSNTEAPANNPPEVNNTFPVSLFLDSLLFKRSLGHLRDPTFQLDADLVSFVGNVSVDRAFVSSYFVYIHPWLPFLSKKLFMERVLNPLGMPRPECTLLMAAMKLLAKASPEVGSHTPEYDSVKTCFHRAEASGVINFRVLQSMIMTALYEIGHAIYPAAYMTVAHCIQYGRALGLDKSIGQNSTGTSDAIESEEKRRSWWAIFVLDRYIHLGCAERACLLSDPTNNSILPTDDSIWELAIEGPVNLISTPPTTTMGRFCLTVQAAILLGKVFRNIHDDLEDGSGFREQQANMLDGTLVALTKVSLQEGQHRGIGVCSPTTLCYSCAQFLLHDPERSSLSKSSQIDWRATHFPPDIDFELAANMLKLARSLSATGRCGAEEVSPFCLEAMYRAGIFYARRHNEQGAVDDLEAFQVVKAGLGVMGGRWRTAAAYAEMLNARELTGIL